MVNIVLCVEVLKTAVLVLVLYKLVVLNTPHWPIRIMVCSTLVCLFVAAQSLSSQQYGMYSLLGILLVSLLDLMLDLCGCHPSTSTVDCHNALSWAGS